MMNSKMVDYEKYGNGFTTYGNKEQDFSVDKEQVKAGLKGLIKKHKSASFAVSQLLMGVSLVGGIFLVTLVVSAPIWLIYEIFGVI